MKNFIFITGNQAKADQLSHHLGRDVEHRKVDLDEIQSHNLEGIVKDKAKRAFDIVGTPVLVEDVSLKYHALGNLPGPLIRWFLEELGNKGLCRLINHYNKDRSAVAEVCYCLYDGKNYQLFNSVMEGRIAAHPKGDKGFGWDPIFIPNGSKLTWAEITDLDQGSSGMRKIALDKLKKFLISK